MAKTTNRFHIKVRLTPNGKTEYAAYHGKKKIGVWGTKSHAAHIIRIHKEKG